LAIVLVPAVLLGQTAQADSAGPTDPLAVQERAHGVSKRPLSQKELAVACEKGDPQGLLNTPCSEIVRFFNETRPELQLKNTADLAGYIRNHLVVVDCPTDGQEYKLNRVLMGRIMQDRGAGWQRRFAEGEQCLYNNNEARIEFSLSCANSPFGQISVASAMVTEVEKEILHLPISPLPTRIERDTTPTLRAMEFRVEASSRTARFDISRGEKERKERERSSWLSRNWGWPVGGLLVGTAVGIIGHHNGWWGGDITQCVSIGTPGVCSRK